MIEYIKFKFALRKLFKSKEETRVKYSNFLALARSEKKSIEDIQGLEHEAYFEESMIDEEISLLVTRYLTSKARRQFIPIPPINNEEMWEKCSKISLSYVLTDAGISNVRSLLGKEAKEKRDSIVTFIAAITGLIGTVTGLIAIINK